MARRRNPVVTACVTGASLAFIHLTRILPISVCRMLGRGIGRVAYTCVPRVRRVALSNLDHAYGDSLSTREKRRIALDAARNMGMVAALFSHIPRLREGDISRFVRVEGLEHIDRERGGFMVGGHYGNWEWMAPAACRAGLRAAEVVRPLDSARLNAVIDRIRRSSGAVTLPKDNAGTEIRKYLRDGYIVGVLIDQSPRENGVPVTFFNQPCWATVAPAMIALRTKMPIHPVVMIPEDDGRYTLRFYPAVTFERTGDLRTDLVAITQRCQDVMEEVIREKPGPWLWMHRRWKPRERLQREWDAKSARNAGASE